MDFIDPLRNLTNWSIMADFQTLKFIPKNPSRFSKTLLTKYIFSNHKILGEL